MRREEVRSMIGLFLGSSKAGVQVYIRGGYSGVSEEVGLTRRIIPVRKVFEFQ